MNIEDLRYFNYKEEIETSYFQGFFSSYSDVAEVGEQVSFSPIGVIGTVLKKKIVSVGGRGNLHAVRYDYDFIVTDTRFMQEMEVSVYVKQSLSDLLNLSPIPISVESLPVVTKDVGPVYYEGDVEGFIQKCADWLGKIWYYNGIGVTFANLPQSGSFTLPNDVLRAEIERGYFGNIVNGLKYKYMMQKSGVDYLYIWLKRDELRIWIEAEFKDPYTDEECIMFRLEGVYDFPKPLDTIESVTAEAFEGDKGLSGEYAKNIREWDWELVNDRLIIKIRIAKVKEGNIVEITENLLEELCGERRADFRVSYYYIEDVPEIDTIGASPYKFTEIDAPEALKTPCAYKILFFNTLRSKLTYTLLLDSNEGGPRIGSSSGGLIQSVEYNYDKAGNKLLCTVEVIR